MKLCHEWRDKSCSHDHHEHAWLMVPPSTIVRTIMYDLFVTTYVLKSHVQCFKHDHRPCYDRICSCNHQWLRSSDDVSAISLWFVLFDAFSWQLYKKKFFVKQFILLTNHLAMLDFCGCLGDISLTLGQCLANFYYFFSDSLHQCSVCR